MEREDNNLLNIISEAENGFEIRSKASADAQGVPTLEGKPYAGTGAYQFKERAQGQYIRFERVPYQHWRAIRNFLSWRFGSSAKRRRDSLLSSGGEVHFTVLPSDLRVEAGEKGIRYDQQHSGRLRTFLSYFCCSMKDPKDPPAGPLYPESPMWGPASPRALNKAINREEMNNAFFEGKGEMMTSQCTTPPARDGTRPGLQRWPEEYGYDRRGGKSTARGSGLRGIQALLGDDPRPTTAINGPAEDLSRLSAAIGNPSASRPSWRRPILTR